MDEAYSRLESRLDKMDAKIEQSGVENREAINGLIDDINKAFAESHKNHRRFGDHVVRRLDDI